MPALVGRKVLSQPSWRPPMEEDACVSCGPGLMFQVIIMSSMNKPSNPAQLNPLRRTGIACLSEPAKHSRPADLVFRPSMVGTEISVPIPL
jgi:hypothetical protein